LECLLCCYACFFEADGIVAAEEFDHSDGEWTMMVAINIDVTLEVVA
jgi:hypothetical protein